MVVYWIYAGGLIAVVASQLAFFFWARDKKMGLERQIEALKTLHKATQQQNDLLRNEIIELRSTISHVNHKGKELEQSIAHLSARQDEVVYKDPETRLYSRATKMVELGADVEEIMRECELPRAEAQLLVRLHQKTVDA